MPYCQECGSYYEQDISVCSSCGNKFFIDQGNNEQPSAMEIPTETPGANSNTTTQLNSDVGKEEFVAPFPELIFKEGELLERATESKENSIIEESAVEFVLQEGTNFGVRRNQAESHLGKGLIKPVAIESCMDGYHFKYDEPPRQITKSEPQKEKVVEFRVSGEPEFKVQTNEEEIEAEKFSEDISDKTETEPDLLETDSQAETDNNTEKTNSEDATPLEEVSIPEEEIFSPTNVEPEIRSEIKSEALWEGQRTWYGLPLKEKYRVTDRAVLLLDGDGQELKAIEWRLVSAISLKHNWFSKLLAIGDLEIIGSDSELLLILKGIEHPERLQKLLVETVELKV